MEVAWRLRFRRNGKLERGARRIGAVANSNRDIYDARLSNSRSYGYSPIAATTAKYDAAKRHNR